MENDLKVKKCLKCGAIVKAIKNCECEDCGIMCCGEAMQEVVANSVDAVVEKHVPTYELDGEVLKVRVNHVMEEEHYIEWICLKTEDREEFVYLKTNEEAAATFNNVKSGTLYAYCNKHGLWSAEI